MIDQVTIGTTPPAEWKRATARKNHCGRNLFVGPGTCKLWWEGCPEKKAPDCFNRFCRTLTPEQQEIAG